MDKYEQITVVGEGSYGVVMKCRHKESDQVVAIKKFLETEEDATIRKMALREIRMLKRLKHENLVAMIEVFRHRKRFFLVFEYLEGTVLDELEKAPSGLGEEKSREHIYQVIRAINYCHSNHIIHRDVKPENVLVSSLGVVKLCDFGFARLVCISGEPCTEYVATRWYRAPELLVGETTYGAPVDIWAIGCLFVEMMSGDPLFPGESDIDQLYQIVKMLGKPCGRHQQLMSKNSQLRGMIKSASSGDNDFYQTFPDWSLYPLEFVASCMRMDPHDRSTSEELLKNPFFIHDRFPQKFLPILRERVNAEYNENPLLRKHRTEILMSTDKKEELYNTNKPRKSSHPDQSRWKYDGAMKRKYSYEIYNTDHAEKNLISLSKTSQRLSVVQKSGGTILKQPSKDKTKIGTEMEMLEKSLESLVRFQNVLPRPASTHKETPERPITPPQFQSLQPNVLHPSINNISFTRDPPKKSPSLLTCARSTLNQVPLLNNPRSQFLKKLERNVLVDSVYPGQEGLGSTSWLTGFTSNIHKKKDVKVKSDVFTLPNLPGASPNKNKKKVCPDPDSMTVTPRIQSSSSLSPSKNSNSFPLM